MFLEVTAVDSPRPVSLERITADDNARYDRRWRWFTEPGCRIFTFRTPQPRISVVFDTQRTLTWASGVGDGRYLALFECARDNPGQSVPVPCVIGVRSAYERANQKLNAMRSPGKLFRASN